MSLRKSKNSSYKSNKLWRQRNPIKISAHRKVYVEVRAKRIIPQKCFCGKKGEAHHQDYKIPLLITWLCKKHHVKADRKRKGSLGYFDPKVFAEFWIKNRGIKWFKKNHPEMHKLSYTQ